MRRLWRHVTAGVFVATLFAAVAAEAQPPVARPQPPPAAPGAAPVTPPSSAPSPAPSGAQPTTEQRQAGEAARSADAAGPGMDTPPSPDQLNAPLFPAAQFLGSYDAGEGQRYYLYGCTQSFTELVQYYRTVLKDKGELVFDEPATHMFEVGKFKETEVAFPPSVTIKDYTWKDSPGYLNPKPGGVPAAFPTVIQIVTPPPALAKRRDR